MKKKAPKWFIIMGLAVAIAFTLYLKSSPQGVNEKIFEEKYVSSKVAKKIPKMIELGSDTCVPCKMMEPILEELKKDYSNEFSVIFIDVQEKPELAKEYRIRIIPTQIFFDEKGIEKFRHEGFFSKQDILSKFDEMSRHKFLE